MVGTRAIRFHSIALFLAFAAMAGGILFAAGRPFAYPLDDTYIHLAVGRTIATAGVWGVIPSEPAAASSSPLWSLLLAGIYRLYSGFAFVYVPLGLNLLAAAGLIWLLLAMFRRSAISILLVTTIGFAAAGPSLGVLGMEHMLHALLAVALCFVTCRMVAAPAETAGAGRLAGIALLAALSVAARYESLFLVAPLALVALFRRRFGVFLALLAGGALPVVGFGLLWVHDGGWFLPNSLLLKRDMLAPVEPLQKLRQLADNLALNLRQLRSHGGFVPMLGLLALLLAWRLIRRNRGELPPLFAACALATTFLHLTFASVGWLYRYEAWLIVLDVTAILLLAETLMPGWALVGLAVLIGVAFGQRTEMATIRTLQAIDDRRLEHLPPAEFVDRFYAGQTIMVNDLGATAWFDGRTRVLDLYGLGSNMPLRLRLAPSGYDADRLRDWASRTNTRIAIIQVCWTEIRKRLPEEWKLVELWEVPRNVVFGDRLVGFFAVAPDEADALRRNLDEFQVPAAVKRLTVPLNEAMVSGCR